jgi:hypothetical protein
VDESEYGSEDESEYAPNEKAASDDESQLGMEEEILRSYKV